MGKKSFKGRIVNKIKREQSYLIKVEEPFIINEVRPSLKGRVQALPKTAFWQRVGSWPFAEEEKYVQDEKLLSIFRDWGFDGNACHHLQMRCLHLKRSP